jgi:hypothetical protein
MRERKNAFGQTGADKRETTEQLHKLQSFSSQLDVALFDGKISVAERQQLDLWRLKEGLAVSARNKVLKSHGVNIEAWSRTEPRKKSMVSATHLVQLTTEVKKKAKARDKNHVHHRRKRLADAPRFPRSHLWKWNVGGDGSSLMTPAPPMQMCGDASGAKLRYAQAKHVHSEQRANASKKTNKKGSSNRRRSLVVDQLCLAANLSSLDTPELDVSDNESEFSEISSDWGEIDNIEDLFFRASGEPVGAEGEVDAFLDAFCNKMNPERRAKFVQLTTQFRETRLSTAHMDRETAASAMHGDGMIEGGGGGGGGGVGGGGAGGLRWRRCQQVEARCAAAARGSRGKEAP